MAIIAFAYDLLLWCNHQRLTDRHHKEKKSVVKWGFLPPWLLVVMTPESPSSNWPTTLLAMLTSPKVQTFQIAVKDVWTRRKMVGVFPFNEPTQRWVPLALINELQNLSHAPSLPVLPRQCYKLAEWCEAYLKQWVWSQHTWNPRQQAESIWEVRDSLGSNLCITFLASAQAEAGQPDSAGGLNLLVGMQSEIPPLVRPSTASAPSAWGDGKPQNVNPGMWGVHNWGSYMDLLDSTEKETSVEPEGVLGGPLNTTTLAMVGTSRGGKQVHKSQSRGSGLMLSSYNTQKGKTLPKSMGAQPKTTTPYTFASKDICYRDAAHPHAKHPTDPLHPQGEPDPLKDPLRWVRWHVACYWGHTNGAYPLWATKVWSVCPVHYW